MAKDPAFPMYASDWLGSSQIALMSADQERGYLRLLCHMWNSGCALPDDDQALSRLSLMNEGWFNGGCRLVRDCFIEHPDKPGFITHEKLLAIKAERDEWRAKSIEGGKKSAQLRKSGLNLKGGTKGGSTTVATTGSTKAQPNGNSPSPSPSSILSSKEESMCVRKRFVPPSVADVEAYCTEKDYSVDANHFVDFYISKGWKVGREPMKDWRAAVRNWVHNGYGNKSTQFAFPQLPE
jgi:hypothetical protein